MTVFLSLFLPLPAIKLQKFERHCESRYRLKGENRLFSHFDAVCEFGDYSPVRQRHELRFWWKGAA
jgi:hypothetical protein